MTTGSLGVATRDVVLGAVATRDVVPGEESVTGRRRVMDLDRVPRLVFWETTKACPLACVHCRATAQCHPAPDELSTEEAMAVIDELAAAPRPTPVLILTGGDCLQRRDLGELTAYAKSVAVPVAISPSVSPSLNAGVLSMLRANGVRSASLSLDGAVAGTHERVRQVPGHFAATISAIGLLQQCGFAVQVNSAVMAQNVGELADMAALLIGLDVKTWEVFFLIGVGRGHQVAEIEGDEYEDVCHFLVDAAQYGMTVRTVEAPFFRRVRDLRSKRADPGLDPALAFGLGPLYRELRGRLRAHMGEPRSPVLAPTVATRDGKGIVFVGHDGGVYPAGFLPLALGSVRDRKVLDIYRDDPTLQAIRSARFPGRCGRCEYADECGGSRARAYAATGDPLADDPACRYRRPEGHDRSS
ncbi:MAG TPA: TIGR04053 family radical SAM/SPASM domain-containing protein [Acidimicrobiales bacterium]|nr:TIGR04053 family radical SAM/SPASM domain-containing protein [Acidimicrobiales bacterium]